MRRFDAVVIGGGPAGSSIGNLLAGRGLRVAIFEKNSPPKDKICGEFLSPAIWPILERLNLTKPVLAEKGTPVKNVCFFAGRQYTELPLPVYSDAYPYAYGISRKRFDTVLLNASRERGCEILNEEVGGAEESSNGFRIHFSQDPDRSRSIETRFVVNATGKNHRACSVSAPPMGTETRIGFKAHFRGPSLEDKIKLFFFDGGYLGMVNVEGQITNVCGILNKSAFKKAGSNFDRALEVFSKQNRFFAGWLDGAQRQGEWLSCSPVIHARRSPCRNGIFHVGDAAFFLEPFFGQGMTLALASSLLLSKVITGGTLPVGKRSIVSDYEKHFASVCRGKSWIGKFFNCFSDSSARASLVVRSFKIFPRAAAAFFAAACRIKNV